MVLDFGQAGINLAYVIIKQIDLTYTRTYSTLSLIY